MVFLTLAKNLRKKGVDVFFWYFDHFDDVEEVLAEQVSFVKYTDTSDFDLVQTVGLRPDLYVRRFHKKIKCPTVTTMENYVEDDLKFQYGTLVSKIFSPVWRFGTRRHDAFVTLQNDMKEYYSKNWGVKESEVIANCSEVKIGKSEKAIEDKVLEHKGSHILLGSVGYATERKGIRQVVQLLKERPDLYWVHFGDGKSLNSTKEMATELGVIDRALFLGMVPNASAYLKLFDVFVMPSYSEGMPLAMLEAVMQKVPCVSTDIDIFKAIFTTEESGQFKPGDISGFSKEVDRVLKSKESIVKKSYEKYESTYSSDVVSNKYIELYKRLIEEKKQLENKGSL